MEERSTVEVLKAARDRISDPERWCQETEAQDAIGRNVEPTNAAAVRWCFAGAVYAEGVDATTAPHIGVSQIGRILNEAIGVEGAGPWNDAPDRSHADVLEAFDRAIQLAEERECA